MEGQIQRINSKPLDNLLLSKIFNTKYSKVLLAAVALSFLFFGALLIIRTVFSKAPNSHKSQIEKPIAKNDLSSSFREKVNPVPNGSYYDIGFIQSDRDFSNEYSYLLATKPQLSTIYRINATSQETFFTTSKKIEHFDIYKNGIVVYSVNLNLKSMLWIRDLNRESFLIFTSSENEKILSSQIDFERQSIYIFTIKDQVVNLYQASVGVEQKFVANFGALTSRINILNIEKNVLKLIDGTTCFNLQLNNFEIVEVPCYKSIQNPNNSLYKLSPRYANFFSSNDGTTIDKVNVPSGLSTRILNVPRGIHLYLHQAFGTKLLLSSFDLVLDAQTNRFRPKWKNLVALNLTDFSLDKILEKLPFADSNISDVVFFEVSPQIYAFEKRELETLIFAYIPSQITQTSPLSNPISNPVSFAQNPDWKNLNFINDIGFESMRIYMPVYEV